MASARKYDINGWAEVPNNPISKVGVFQYSGRAIGAPDPNKMYNVYRPESELNNAETIESFKLLPFIDDHPHDMLGSVDEDLPTVDGKPAEGVIGERVAFEYPYLKANLKIFTDRIAQAIAAGKKEVSAGFRCMYEKASGQFEGQSYDYIQRKIRGNHVALVKNGRMGPEVAVLDHFQFTFDSQEIIMTDPVKKDPATPAGDADGENKGAMTIDEAIALLNTIAPQVAKLTEAMAKMAPGSAPAVIDEPVIDKDEADPMTPAGDADKPVTAGALDALEKRITKVIDAKLKPFGTKALDARDVIVAIGDKVKLYDGVSRLTGAFDHSEMDAQAVAKYGVEKLNIAGVPAGGEILAVNAYLQAKNPVAPKAANAMDAKDQPVSAIKKHVNQV